MDRRDFLHFSVGTAAAPGISASVSHCAAGAGAGVAADAAFNPAVWSWLSDLAQSVAAAELVNFLGDGTKEISRYWRSWLDGVNSSADNYGEIWSDCWAHSIPPVVLVQVTKGQTPNDYQGDPMRDGLLP